MAKNVEYERKNKLFTEDQLATHIHPDGPSSNVDWCFPVLPGILLTESGYSIGPRCGTEGVKIIYFYGFGCVELVKITERIA
jgi:hypothetical protein